MWILLTSLALVLIRARAGSQAPAASEEQRAKTVPLRGAASAGAWVCAGLGQAERAWTRFQRGNLRPPH